MPQSQGTMQLQGKPHFQRARSSSSTSPSVASSNWSLSLGPLEPTPTAPQDLGILGDVAAPTQDLSYTIANNEQLAKLESEGLTPLKLKAFPSEECTMLGIANIIRSKNSAPFELTLDIMLDTREAYELVKNANILTNERVMELYHLLADDITTYIFSEPVLA
ncbi:hypothetical protein N7444_009789 [Penicillium canescens]|nr:hypothetical protein N7444_009789 [Penicillium canescens]